MNETQRFFHSHAYIYTNLCSCNKSAHSAVKPLRGWQLYLEIKQERHTDTKKGKKLRMIIGADRTGIKGWEPRTGEWERKWRRKWYERRQNRGKHKRQGQDRDREESELTEREGKRRMSPNVCVCGVYSDINCFLLFIAVAPHLPHHVHLSSVSSSGLFYNNNRSQFLCVCECMCIYRYVYLLACETSWLTAPMVPTCASVVPCNLSAFKRPWVKLKNIHILTHIQTIALKECDTQRK